MIEDRQLMEKFNSLWTLSLRDAAENGEGAEPDKWLAMRYFKFGYEARQEKEVEMEGTVVIEGGKPYEEDFKAAQEEFAAAWSKIPIMEKYKVTQEQVREFFFVKGRESGKVAVDPYNGTVYANVGVQVAEIEELDFYTHTDSSYDRTQYQCDDDDCSCLEVSTEDRIKGFGEDLKKVADPKFI